jgi:Flp pilus assembly protein TadD
LGGSKLKWLIVGGKVKARVARATQLFNEGKYQEAEKELRDAIQIYPEHEVSHCNLGMVLASLNRLMEAEKELREAIRLKPFYIDAHSELASVLYKLGRKPEAEAAYKDLILLDPENPFPRMNLATLYIGRGAFDEAEKEYRAALNCRKIDPETKRKIQDTIQGG